MLNIEVNSISKFDFDKGKFYKLSKILKDLNLIQKDVNISLGFIDKDTMKELNKKFNNLDYATDVLSFNFQENEEPFRFKQETTFLGEILICLPILKEQAKVKNISEEEEFWNLFIHGLLHILGFDHYDEISSKKMFSLQENILSKLYVRSK